MESVNSDSDVGDLSTLLFMVLGIDLRCLPADGSAGSGVAHAARAISEELVRQHQGKTVLYVPKGAMLFPDAQSVVWLEHVTGAALLAAIQKNPCDKLFVPSGAIAPGLTVPAIPLVHDCDIFDHPEWFPQAWWKRWLTTRLFLRGVRAAPLVFTVSDYTKKAVERLEPAVQGRVRVTGAGGDDVLASIPAHQLVERKREAAQRLAPRGISRRFVLVLGTIEPRKNIPFICGIWPDIARTVPRVDLVIAGQDGWKTTPIRDALYACAAQLEPLDSRGIRLKDFSEDERRDLLLAADVVLVPSFSEGFGLVALEAIQAGTPVLASKRGALPEVVGKGEWLMDPSDAGSWARAIIHLLDNPAARLQMAAAQSHRGSIFSWEKTAARVLDEILH